MTGDLISNTQQIGCRPDSARSKSACKVWVFFAQFGKIKKGKKFPSLNLRIRYSPSSYIFICVFNGLISFPSISGFIGPFLQVHIFKLLIKTAVFSKKYIVIRGFITGVKFICS